MKNKFKGSFRKKNNEIRTMTFLKLKDLSEYYPPKEGDGNETRTLPEGMELVFDLDSKGIRTFNNKTRLGELEKFTISDEEISLLFQDKEV